MICIWVGTTAAVTHRFLPKIGAKIVDYRYLYKFLTGNLPFFDRLCDKNGENVSSA